MSAATHNSCAERRTLTAFLMLATAFAVSGCVEMDVIEIIGCLSDADCPTGMTCFESDFGGFCALDQNKNGIADLIDLGFDPKQECKGNDCFNITRIQGSDCAENSDCLPEFICANSICIDGSDGSPCTTKGHCDSNFLRRCTI